MNPNKILSRRKMLRHGAGALGAVMLTRIVFHSQRAEADNGNKAILHYQDSPKEGHRCADCTAFKPGAEADTGTCKVVGGPVSPNGWCMAFSRR
ncbi:high-potential iron-sulfur protein [Ralstonia insidiosa]|jgi:hypothetical protein|uniref:high-potential iron-sulfur protein n=2 Tax=Pseudomonadota TaxID=1224 RepID=UPI000664A05C|nr:high-potential iron-sulfur protein [Ralstonia insidiosa]KMW45582.1 iron oxidase [Ralstonia sp. MD27]MBX3772416.1 high-potential iron-sulfur protein [Ralstonia pickettii]NOZ17705.1 iron oxidase [Betaproteobacteria bacterium]MBA9857072.1 iron oxidase [Ralstonia insidiosa]MBA9870173.1 iron oxidase [Ralstonia insidiosa]